MMRKKRERNMICKQTKGIIILTEVCEKKKKKIYDETLYYTVVTLKQKTINTLRVYIDIPFHIHI